MVINARIEHLQDRNAAVAEVGLFVDRDFFEATGSSKREPGEIYDEEVGRNLAIGRALESLGRQIEDKATERYNSLNPPESGFVQGGFIPAVGEGMIVGMGTVTGVTEDGTVSVNMKMVHGTRPSRASQHNRTK